MKYSFIVTVYNKEKYLEKCIASLVNQNFDDYEIVIVDDGSTDNSSKIIDKYKSEYSNKIMNFKKENGGMSSARNYGIEHANGEYLLFIDADDYIGNNTLKIVDENISKSNMDILVFNISMDNNGVISKTNSFMNIDDRVKKYITSNPSPCNKVIRRSIFIDNNIKFMEGIYYEDLALIPTLAKYTGKIDFIDDSLYYYRVVDDSIMNKKKYNKKMEDVFIALEYNYNELHDKYSDEVEYLYIDHLLRYASLRFLDYNKLDNINKIVDIINNKFKNWNNNLYFKKYYDFKKKIMCKLIYKRKYKIIKLLRKG